MAGMISTLNRTGVMLEELVDLSKSFAEYAGACGEEVLDMGCAFGVATVAALERGAYVLAVDMEQRHLDILSERITEEARARISLRQGVLPDIDFEDGRFGAIHASRVIHFLSPRDIQKTIKKMYRWLKPGGKLFLITDTPYVGYWSSKFSDYETRKAAGDLWPGYIKDVRSVFDAKAVKDAPPLINPLDPDILHRECLSAGFHIEKADFFDNPAMSGSVKPGKAHAGVIAVKPRALTKTRFHLSPINTGIKTIPSSDNVSVCCQVYGNATPALVFVHGLGCNRTYWDRQVSHFSLKHSVVTIDLPGHGDSGTNRVKWTIEAFGKDVVSVIKDLDLKSVILIGHSLGGPVITEAASYMRKRVIGLVGVDTLHNLSPKQMTHREVESLCETISDYGKDCLQDMPDPKLREYIETCRASVASGIRDEAFREMVLYLQAMDTNFSAPLVLINSSQWLPTNMKAAQNCNAEVKFMDNVGHFCMMEDPKTFNSR